MKKDSFAVMWALTKNQEVPDQFSPLLGLFSDAYPTSREPNLPDVFFLTVVSITPPPDWTPFLMV